MGDTDAARLPEVARSLRSFGRAGDAAACAAHDAVFGALLAARRTAAMGTAEEALATLNGAAIRRQIDRDAAAAATAGVTGAPHRRARHAAALDVLDALHEELAALDALASLAKSGGVASEAWRRWTLQLARVFDSADAACEALSEVLRRRPDGP